MNLSASEHRKRFGDGQNMFLWCFFGLQVSFTSISEVLALKTPSVIPNKHSWSILRPDWRYSCPKFISHIIFIQLVLGAQRELCVQILRENRPNPSFGIQNWILQNLTWISLFWYHFMTIDADGIRYLNYRFLKIQRPKSNRMLLNFIAPNKVAKNLSETVLRLPIGWISWEEIAL